MWRTVFRFDISFICLKLLRSIYTRTRKLYSIILSLASSFSIIKDRIKNKMSNIISQNSKFAKLSLNENSAQNHATINIFCFDISNSSKSLQFVILTSLTFVFFLLYGYLQELLYQLPGFSDFSWFLTLVQFFFYSCFAIIESVVRNDLQRK